MRLIQGAFSLARYPFRIPLFVLQRSLSGAADVVRFAGRVSGVAREEQERWRPGPAATAESNGAPAPEPAPDRPAPRRRAEPVREAAEPVASEPEPVHVSEEPVLVAEVAEEGAEEGAGPEVRVDQPWEGYDSMTAPQIVRRLHEAEPAEVAAVRLYEASHKGRSSVLAAAGAAR